MIDGSPIRIRVLLHHRIIIIIILIVMISHLSPHDRIEIQDLSGEVEVDHLIVLDEQRAVRLMLLLRSLVLGVDREFELEVTHALGGKGSVSTAHYHTPLHQSQFIAIASHVTYAAALAS